MSKVKNGFKKDSGVNVHGEYYPQDDSRQGKAAGDIVY